MDKEEFAEWKYAGQLARKALEFGIKHIKKGNTVLAACTAVDDFIVENGAFPAWPTQISCDACAAHATAAHEDPTVFENQLASLDVGVHLDSGIVGDNAFTVDLSGKWKDHLSAAKDALNAAMKIVAPGVHTSEIGKVVQEAIQSHGLNPVVNLSGHGISPFVIHDKPSIPNVATKGSDVLEEDQIIAIEPFATNGVGVVQDSSPTEIYALEGVKPTRNIIARKVLAEVEEEFGPFPFAKRWLVEKYGVGRTSLALKELVRMDAVAAHPPLVEKSGGVVSVFEHTLLVKDKPIVMTKGD